MNTDDLTSLLRDATDDLEPRPGFATTVLRGGRRRQVRRRLAVATSAATAVALLGGGAYAVVQDDGPAQVTAADQGDPLLSEPTKGDLAGDQAFLDRAVAEWKKGLLRSPDADRGVYDDMRGEPHVYWAGNTSAGRAAVVAQQHHVHQNDQLHQKAGGLKTAVGLVAKDAEDGELKLVTDQWQTDPSGEFHIGQFLFGPGDRTLLVATETPVYYSLAPLVRDHRIIRDWERAPEHDGVAITQLPEDADPLTMWAFEQDAEPAPDQPVTGVPSVMPQRASDYLKRVAEPNWFEGLAPTGIRWSGVLTAGSAGGPQFDVFKTYVTEVSVKLSCMNGFADGYHIRVGMPDGRVAVLSDVQCGGLPARFYTLIVTPDLKYQVYEGGEVDANAALPVQFRLPDQQGWIVAQLNQPLQYRTSPTGAWQDAGVSAALVPDDTVQVRVGDQVVDLPR